MQNTDKIRIACPNGHSLLAPQRAAGKTLPCPVCRSMVTVKSSTTTSDEPDAMVALRERIATIAARQPIPPQPAKRDTLSDTGVMRILGDYDALPEHPVAWKQPKQRPCPRCGRGVSLVRSVCNHCQCYVGTAADPSPDAA